MNTQFSLTTKEAAEFFRVSKSTIYRWIRKKEISAKKIKRRWVIYPGSEPEGGKIMGNWPTDVHRRTAEADGLTAKDFDVSKWPLSNVRIVQPAYGTPKEVSISYHCDIPSSTPEANQYNPDTGEKIADPVGMTLKHVLFQLREIGTSLILDEDLRGRDAFGKVKGFVPSREKNGLWQKLTPGKTIRVVLGAIPRFYYLNEDGGAMLAYARDNKNICGELVVSQEYELSMDADGVIYIDGEAPPKPPEPTHEGLDEYNQIIAKERAESERIERELEERLAREKKEREERWAREDAVRKEEERKALEAAEAERKRNEPYIQYRAKETVQEFVDMLMQTYDFHMKGMTGGDEQFKQYLSSLKDHSEYGPAARQTASNFGWTL